MEKFYLSEATHVVYKSENSSDKQMYLIIAQKKNKTTS